MLSATPMYNSYKEIVWLINIMNINDNRPEMAIKDVFNTDGTFVIDENGIETGKELLERKATGYVSYVRGDNPYTFPYRIWPTDFSPEDTFKQRIKPERQLNGSKISQPLEILDLFLSDIGEYQKKGYNHIIEQIRTKANRRDTPVVNIPNDDEEPEGVEETKGDDNDMPQTGGAIEEEDADEAEDTVEAEDADEEEDADEAEDTVEAEDADEEEDADEAEDTVEAEDADEEEDADEAEDADEEEDADEAEDADEEDADEEDADEAEDAVNKINIGDELEESQIPRPDDAMRSEETVISKEAEMRLPTFDNMERFGYQMLLKPLESLIMVYPNKKLDDDSSANNISGIVGKEGLNRVMTHKQTNKIRHSFKYSDDTMRDYGSIFSPDEIGKYSGKIKSICNIVMKSKGVVLIYSQYIDGGIIPIALALEELGLTRASGGKSLFETPPTEPIDAVSLKPKSVVEGVFNSAKYVMITGDKSISPDNVVDLKSVTSLDNVNGEKVKVVLISLAGAEGLDFKFIRQVHVVEPWYNMNRIEQIIGRAVRTCSHKNLDFIDRNVEIYLHGTLIKDSDEEAADLYVYRVAEAKAVTMGRVSRVIKTIAVDCLLNSEQMNFSIESMKENGVEKKVIQNFSTKKGNEYTVGDKPMTAICDYMDKCMYSCKTKDEGYKLLENNTNMSSYRKEFINVNTDRIIKRIRVLMKNRFFYKKSEMITEINQIRDYPLIQIFAALNKMIEDKSEYITDKYNRIGNLINIGDLYLFQPLEIKNENISVYERSTPVEYKRPAIKIDLTNRQEVDLKQTDDEIMDDMNKKYTSAMNTQSVISGEKDWYALAGPVINVLKQSKKFENQNIEDALVGHIIDKLDFENTLSLINYIEKNKDSELSEFHKKIQTYLENQIIKNDKITGYYLNNYGVRALYKLVDGEWIEGLPSDQGKIENEITASVKSVKSQINDHFGFISYDVNSKTNEFKIKDNNDSRVKGYRCQQKSKKHVVALFKKIIGEDDYNLFKKNIEKNSYGVKKLNSNNFNAIQICILLEMYFRIYSNNNTDGKIWFLNPLEYIIKQKVDKQKKNSNKN
jgi:hypothetical protein